MRDSIFTEVGCVVDGDTLNLIECGGEAVRMYGADTPEVFTDDGIPQCYAELASEYTKSILTPGTQIRLDFDVCTTDPYGRTLAYVHVLQGGDTGGSSDTLFLNEDLIRRGYARLYRDDVGCAQDIRYFDYFDQLEQSAKAAKVGLWGACDP